MSIRMRRPETRKIDLSMGDWILVKQFLTAGEVRDMYAHMMTTDAITGREQLRRTMVGISKAVAFLLDWSFQDADGTPLVIAGEPPDVVTSILSNLPNDDWVEVLEAIDEHEKEMDRLRDLEKKTHAGATRSLATSPSPGDSDGATNGSANSIEMSTSS